MSESILKALMQLFAITARVDGATQKGRGVVKAFLKQQLSTEKVEEYLALYDKYLEAHQTDFARDSSKKQVKRTAANSVKILLICTQINSELTQKQKIVVLIRLIELINTGTEASPLEIEFVTVVANTFNIDDEEFIRCISFVRALEDQIPDSSKILVIDNKQHSEFNVTKHIYSEVLHGQIRVLRILSVNMYVFRYFGSLELYLNGQLIQNDRVYILTPGSSIRSSKVPPIYYSDIISKFLSDNTNSRYVLEAKNIQFSFGKDQSGIKDLSLIEESGKLVGIMGASGAGKTTLLNLLNGSLTPTSGEITINGFSIHTEKEKLKGVIGYISQDDLLIEELTVYQNLYYNTKLCFGNYSDEQIKKMVDDLLSSLGLYETKDIVVGSPMNKKISGGQRKRLNIGLELIREPSVLFVDEPTSGLSSRDSENIMDLIKELTLKGKLIFVVIHQPSSDIFKMFDKILIMDTGGYPIYYGNPLDAITYFKSSVNHVKSNESECTECGNVNPEQIFNIIEFKVLDDYGSLTRNRKITPAEWNAKYKEYEKTLHPKEITPNQIPKSTFNTPNKVKQFYIYIVRDVLSKIANVQYMVINFIEAPLLALILSYLIKYYSLENTYIYRENENITAWLFMCVVVALFIGLTISAEEIFKDRKILKRESFLDLSRFSYLNSKVVVMFTISAIQTISFIIIGNAVLEIRGMNLDYWLILFTTSCFANMLGLNISSAFNSAVTIYILIPILIIPQLLLSGVIVKFEKLNPTMNSYNTVPFIGETMASRWAYEALAVNQFKNNPYEKQFYLYDKYMSNSNFKKNFWIPQLTSKLDKCEADIAKPDKQENLKKDLLIIQNEIKKELIISRSKIVFNDVDNLSPDHFNVEVGERTKDYLLKLKEYYIRVYNKANTEKDKIISTQSASANKVEFEMAKDIYQNESLGDLVKKSKEVDKIIERNNELIQVADPVYRDPVFTPPLRAHFFAPRKRILGTTYIDTFWVNVLVIWLMCLILYIALFFDLFKKFLEMFDNIGFLRFTKKWKAKQEEATTA